MNNEELPRFGADCVHSYSEKKCVIASKGLPSHTRARSQQAPGLFVHSSNETEKSRLPIVVIYNYLCYPIFRSVRRGANV